MEQPLLVLTNVPDADTAHAIAHQIVEQSLAACVNILPGLHSVYRWQGAIDSASELMLMIKTTQTRYRKLEDTIKKMHPYEIPEIISIPITGGFSPYLQWIGQETQKHPNV